MEHLSVGEEKTAVITYNPFAKAGILIAASVALFPAFIFLTSDEFVLHLLAVGAVAAGIPFLIECVATVSVTLYPDRVVKKRLFLGETTIPARALQITEDQQALRFFHGSEKNVRERITVRRFMAGSGEIAAAESYARNQYRIGLKAEGSGESQVWKGHASGKERHVAPLLREKFHEAVSAYRFHFAFLVFYGIAAAFVGGLSDSFDGFAKFLSETAVRGCSIAFIVASFPLLRWLSPARPPAGEPEARSLKRLDDRSFASGCVANLAGLVALLEFLMLGNLLDFYLLMAAAVFYLVDFHPRLSSWEEAVRNEAPTSEPEASAALPLVPRRRSLQVSLVLVGALAVSSYGETRHPLYRSKKDCLDDWGSDQACQEAPAGTTYHSGGYWYGPRYGRSFGGGGTRSVGTISVSRGGFGSLASFHGSFGG